MGIYLLRLRCAALVSLGIFFSFPAYAQLSGTFIAPGDDCSSLPAGSTAITADPDGDGAMITLVCDGSDWLQEGVVVLSKTGAAPTSSDDGDWTLESGVDVSTSLNVGIGTDAPGAALHVDGDIFYTGTITSLSDRRHKTEISGIGPVLPKLHDVQGVSYVLLDDKKGAPTLGLIAQDVEQVFPELVSMQAGGVKTLNYIGMIAPLVEAVKELDMHNGELARENAELRRVLHQLSARMDVLEGTRRPAYTPYND